MVIHTHKASQQFIEACRQQGVRLNQEVVEDLGFHEYDIRRPSSDIYNSPMVRAIESWAWTVETEDPANPAYQVADKPIAIDQLPPDPIMRMLAGIANAALRPRIPSPVFAHINPATAWATCRDAEMYWNEVFRRIENHADRPRIELFTEGDTIVAVRKAIHNPTGILLRPQRLGQLDYIYPAGSLIQLEARQDMPRDLISWEKTRNEPKRTSWSDVIRVNFSRPGVFITSGAFRRLHFGTHEHTKECACIKCVQRLAKLALSTSEM